MWIHKIRVSLIHKSEISFLIQRVINCIFVICILINIPVFETLIWFL